MSALRRFLRDLDELRRDVLESMRQDRQQAARREDWTTRVRRARLARLGLSALQYRAALVAAADVWCSTGYRRVLPRRVAEMLFPFLGRQFAGRWLAASAEPRG